MNVLITHECSGRVREEFRKLGHNAWSCDLKPAEDGSPFHFQGDALLAMRSVGAGLPDHWDFIGMHPECRFLTVSGQHWNDRGRGHEKTEAALDHVMLCVGNAAANAPKWYLENSIGILSTRWRKPDFIVQPYQFGDDASKATCFWTHGLPRLQSLSPDLWARPRWVCATCKRVSSDVVAKIWKNRDGYCLCHRCDGTPRLRPRYANQTDSGQNRLGPSEKRSADRARTYPGIAKAIAEQWSKTT